MIARARAGTVPVAVQRKNNPDMKLTPEASGTFAIAPTPFFDDGRIDFDSIDRLTDFYREVGCNGITVLGILGEAPKMEAQESLDVAVLPEIVSYFRYGVEGPPSMLAPSTIEAGIGGAADLEDVDIT